MSNLKDRALRAAERFVGHRGYDIVSTAYKLQDGVGQRRAGRHRERWQDGTGRIGKCGSGGKGGNHEDARRSRIVCAGSDRMVPPPLWL